MTAAEFANTLSARPGRLALGALAVVAGSGVLAACALPAPAPAVRADAAAPNQLLRQVPLSPPSSMTTGSPGDPAPVPWAAANARVAQIGGWRAYAREAAAAATPAR